MNKRSEDGFSYIDVMIAMVILMVGILALVSAISASVLLSKGQEKQLNAKQIATTTMESIMAAKETADASRLGWPAVGNVGSNLENGIPRGIFLTGFNSVMSQAGPDEVVGTADDTGTPSVDYQRQITITDICDPDRPSYNCPTPGTAPVRMRSVQVAVTYFVGRLQRQEVVTTVLTDYSAN
jgi:Tfp pilus assembly protein PilV